MNELLKPFLKNVKMKVNLHGNPIPPCNGNWYDLAVPESYDLKAGEFRILSLGISIETPEAWTTYILPRSSTFKKYGILMANSMGVIDSSYRGDNDIIGFPAYATRDIHIEKGTRIAQLTVMPSYNVSFIPVLSLGNEDRGGFGSTGV